MGIKILLVRGSRNSLCYKQSLKALVVSGPSQSYVQGNFLSLHILKYKILSDWIGSMISEFPYIHSSPGFAGRPPSSHSRRSSLQSFSCFNLKVGANFAFSALIYVYLDVKMFQVLFTI